MGEFTNRYKAPDKVDFVSAYLMLFQITEQENKAVQIKPRDMFCFDEAFQGTNLESI